MFAPHFHPVPIPSCPVPLCWVWVRVRVRVGTPMRLNSPEFTHKRGYGQTPARAFEGLSGTGTCWDLLKTSEITHKRTIGLDWSSKGSHNAPQRVPQTPSKFYSSPHTSPHKGTGTGRCTFPNPSERNLSGPSLDGFPLSEETALGALSRSTVSLTANFQFLFR